MSGFEAPERAVIDAAIEFANDFVEPKAGDWAREGHLPREYFLEAAKYGLCGLLVPETLGGKGVSFAALALVLEKLAESCFASTFALVVHNNLAGNISLNGAAHHQAHLPDMISGEKIGAFLLTEPGVGSDATAIATEVRVTAQNSQLNGAKAWITNGAIADLLSVYAQTAPGDGAGGVANYLIDADREGISRTPPYELAGAGAMNVCGFEFSSSPLAKNDQMIEAGRAFKVAMSGIDLARAVVAAMCCGMLARSLLESVGYTKQRQVFGRPVAEHQTPQHTLADASTDLAAARALTASAINTLQAGERATVAAAHAKKFATKIALQRIADCMQMMGANGALGEYPMSRHLACAKLAQYVDGTSEIQNVVLARELFKD